MPAPAPFACTLALLALVPLAVAPRPAAADTWSHDPNVNVPVVTLPGAQVLDAMVHDSAHGEIVLWVTPNADPFATPPVLLTMHSSHVQANGEIDAAWDTGAIAAGQTNFGYDAMSDSAGGMFVMWGDIRAYATTGRDVYLHHIRAGGLADPSWPVGGRAVCTAAGGQFPSAMISDGHRGVLLFWGDRRDSAASGKFDIYAGHVRADGTLDPAWPANGLLLCSAASTRGSAVAIPDGGGGALVAWSDSRNQATTQADLYATHVRANGTLDPAWPANGRAVITLPGPQNSPQLESDGAGGLFVTWYDYTQPASVQHVLATGVVDPAWPAGGPVLDPTATAIGAVQIAPDGGTGVYAVWDANTTGVLTDDLYATHLLASGLVDPAWPASPVRLVPSASNKSLLAFNAPVVPAGGGMLFQWGDDRNGGSGLYVDRLLPTGTLDPAWPTGGRLLTPQGASAGGAGMIDDGRGGALFGWSDTRDSLATDWNVYADRLGDDGLRGVDQPEWHAIRDVPGDQGGHVTLQWYWSSSDNAPGDPVTGYDVWRQLPASSAANGAARAAKPASVAPAAPGDVRVRGAGATATFWEFLGTVPPRGMPAYAFDVTTWADSTATGAARETFEVDANVGGTIWTSLPDSGASVDNVPPPAPTGFAGAYAGGSSTLQWDPLLVYDLASYRLYRGGSAAFVTDAGNLVASPTTTHFIDAAGGPYWYKLTGLDMHGNEGPAATLLPSGTAGVGTDAPTALALALGSASPARTGAAFALGLPRAMSVRLAVYDEAGRRVRTLLAGDLGAGRHTRAWDLRDDGGRPLPDGLYFVDLVAGGERRDVRIAVLR